MPSESINCNYCGAKNLAGTSRCTACGAPIDLPVTPPVTVTMSNSPARNPVSPANRPDTTPEQIRDALDAAPISNQLKEGLIAAGTGIGALGIGTFFARTAAEAGSIAISTFLIGFFSASNHINILLGIAGGVLIGIMVGLVVKRPIGVLISAPLGTILGLAAGTLLQPTLQKPLLIPVFGVVGGILFALLGGKRGSITGVGKWYTRFRPLLGAMGGLLFAVLGYVIG